MLTAYHFLINHWPEISAILFGIMIPAQLIVNLTPTPVDDRILGKVYRLIEILAGVVSDRAKQLPGEAIIDEILKLKSEEVNQRTD